MPCPSPGISKFCHQLPVFPLPCPSPAVSFVTNSQFFPCRVPHPQ
ncbi:hypothetical protein [Microseira wollei]|nr:hypothetical protein [Microseira wollei]